MAYEADRAARRGLRALAHAERRVQALAAQLPTSPWTTHSAPIHPSQPTQSPPVHIPTSAWPPHPFHAPHMAPTATHSAPTHSGPNQQSGNAPPGGASGWTAPLFQEQFMHHPARQAPQGGTPPLSAAGLHSNGCSPRDGPPWGQHPVGLVPTVQGGQPTCSPAGPLQQPSTGPSLSGWLNSPTQPTFMNAVHSYGAADVSQRALFHASGQNAGGQMQGLFCSTSEGLQQSPAGQSQTHPQQLEESLAEQTQAVEGVLQGVQVRPEFLLLILQIISLMSSCMGRKHPGLEVCSFCGYVALTVHAVGS